MSLAFSGRRLPGSPLATMEGQGCGAMGSGGPEVGLSDSLCVGSSSLRFPFLCRVILLRPSRGKLSRGEIEALIAKGAVELAPSSPGFYSRLFVVQKASGSWRPVIDLSSLNGFVQPVGSPVHQEFRLDDLHRSQGCLPSGSNSSIQQEVPEVCC